MEKQTDSAFILKRSIQLNTVNNKKIKKLKQIKNLSFHPDKNEQQQKKI